MTSPPAAGTKLVLGTAQLSVRYGLFPLERDGVRTWAQQLLDAATEVPLRGIDTAPGYGDAEELIADAPSSIEVFTKLSGFTDFERSIAESLRRLRRTRASIAFIHEATVLSMDDLLDEAHALVGSQYDRLGVSTYSPREFELALADDRISAIQAPVSVADRRLLDAGLLAEAGRRGRLVFARSVYLQGALLASAPDLPPHLEALGGLLDLLDDVAGSLGRSRRDVTSAFVRDVAAIDGVVIGCESAAQLRDNASVMASPPLPDDAREALLAAPRLPEATVDPTHWG